MRLEQSKCSSLWADIAIRLRAVYFRGRRSVRSLNGRRCAGFCLVAGLVALGGTALANEADDLLREDLKAARQAAMMIAAGSSRLSAVAPVPSFADVGHAPYKLGVGLYGAYEPSIYPRETWVDIACFAAPGQDYPGTFRLMYVDVRIYRNRVLVHDSTRGGADRGICDVSRGVDTTFISIPRGLRFDSWTVFVTVAEQRRRGVQIGQRVYRRDTFPSWCHSDEWRCEPATARYQNPAHVYR